MMVVGSSLKPFKGYSGDLVRYHHVDTSFITDHAHTYHGHIRLNRNLKNVIGITEIWLVLSSLPPKINAAHEEEIPDCRSYAFKTAFGIPPSTLINSLNQ